MVPDRFLRTTETLDHTSQQLAALKRSLGLVEKEEALRAADVVQQVGLSRCRRRGEGDFQQTGD